MRMLLLTQWYPPEPDLKGHVLAEEMRRRGHQVEVVTAFPNYPEGRVYPGYRLRWRQLEVLKGVPVLRLPLYPDHSSSPLRRALNNLSFAASAAMGAPVLCREPDVVWAYSPPLTTGIPAWWIGLMRRAPFIFEVVDMLPESLVATGMVRDGVVFQCLGKLAEFVYKRAAAIIVVSPGFKRNLIGKGVPAEKIHYIPNWADEAIFRPVERDLALGKKHGFAGRFNVIFGGNMGPAQELQVVLKAAKILKDVGEIRFALIGDGIDLPNLEAEAKRRSLTNVLFIARQPATEMPRFFAWADALLVHLRDEPLFRITIPSKTLAYLACGRPIVCAMAGDAADVVRQSKAGVVCPPGNPTALAEAIRSLYAMEPSKREELGRAGRGAFLKEYACQVLMDRYERLFESIARSRRSQRTPHRGLVRKGER